MTINYHKWGNQWHLSHQANESVFSAVQIAEGLPEVGHGMNKKCAIFATTE